MSAYKYPSIFPFQMEAIDYIFSRQIEDIVYMFARQKNKGYDSFKTGVLKLTAGKAVTIVKVRFLNFHFLSLCH